LAFSIILSKSSPKRIMILKKKLFLYKKTEKGLRLREDLYKVLFLLTEVNSVEY